MANHKSALKRIRQSEKRRAYNRMYRSRTRTFVKQARSAIASGRSTEGAVETTKAAIRELDRAASKGVIHKRNAARRKSRLMARLNKILAAKSG